MRCTWESMIFTPRIGIRGVGKKPDQAETAALLPASGAEDSVLPSHHHGVAWFSARGARCRKQRDACVHYGAGKHHVHAGSWFRACPGCLAAAIPDECRLSGPNANHT
jgi:hypothetical protein